MMYSRQAWFDISERGNEEVVESPRSKQNPGEPGWQAGAQPGFLGQAHQDHFERPATEVRRPAAGTPRSKRFRQVYVNSAREYRGKEKAKFEDIQRQITELKDALVRRPQIEKEHVSLTAQVAEERRAARERERELAMELAKVDSELQEARRQFANRQSRNAANAAAALRRASKPLALEASWACAAADCCGDYILIDFAIVSPSRDELRPDHNRIVAMLEVGSRVKVLEVASCPPLNRVRARIEEPRGWISVVTLDESQVRWARKEVDDILNSREKKSILEGEGTQAGSMLEESSASRSATLRGWRARVEAQTKAFLEELHDVEGPLKASLGLKAQAGRKEFYMSQPLKVTPDARQVVTHVLGRCASLMVSEVKTDQNMLEMERASMELADEESVAAAYCENVRQAAATNKDLTGLNTRMQLALETVRKAELPSTLRELKASKFGLLDFWEDFISKARNTSSPPSEPHTPPPLKSQKKDRAKFYSGGSQASDTDFDYPKMVQKMVEDEQGAHDDEAAREPSRKSLSTRGSVLHDEIGDLAGDSPGEEVKRRPRRSSTVGGWKASVILSDMEKVAEQEEEADAEPIASQPSGRLDLSKPIRRRVSTMLEDSYRASIMPKSDDEDGDEPLRASSELPAVKYRKVPTVDWKDAPAVTQVLEQLAQKTKQDTMTAQLRVDGKLRKVTELQRARGERIQEIADLRAKLAPLQAAASSSRAGRALSAVNLRIRRIQMVLHRLSSSAVKELATVQQWAQSVEVRMAWLLEALGAPSTARRYWLQQALGSVPAPPSPSKRSSMPRSASSSKLEMGSDSASLQTAPTGKSQERELKIWPQQEESEQEQVDQLPQQLLEQMQRAASEQEEEAMQDLWIRQQQLEISDAFTRDKAEADTTLAERHLKQEEEKQRIFAESVKRFEQQLEQLHQQMTDLQEVQQKETLELKKKQQQAVNMITDQLPLDQQPEEHHDNKIQLEIEKLQKEHMAEIQQLKGQQHLQMQQLTDLQEQHTAAYQMALQHQTMHAEFLEEIKLQHMQNEKQEDISRFVAEKGNPKARKRPSLGTSFEALQRPPNSSRATDQEIMAAFRDALSLFRPCQSQPDAEGSSSRPDGARSLWAVAANLAAIGAYAQAELHELGRESVKIDYRRERTTYEDSRHGKERRYADEWEEKPPPPPPRTAVAPYALSHGTE